MPIGARDKPMVLKSDRTHTLDQVSRGDFTQVPHGTEGCEELIASGIDFPSNYLSMPPAALTPSSFPSIPVVAPLVVHSAVEPTQI